MTEKQEESDKKTRVKNKKKLEKNNCGKKVTKVFKGEPRRSRNSLVIICFVAFTWQSYQTTERLCFLGENWKLTVHQL